MMNEVPIYYTEGYIKTVEVDSGGLKFTFDPVQPFLFDAKDKKVLIVMAKKSSDTGTETQDVVSSCKLDDVKCPGWICSNALTTLKAAKCKVRIYFSEGNYTEVAKLVVL